MLRWTSVETPMGPVLLALCQDMLYRSTLPGHADADFWHELGTCVQLPGEGGRYRRWIERYFAGVHPGPIPPLFSRGTCFSRRVRRIVSEIPPGETRTYGEVACAAASPRAARAVGTVMARNPFPLFVPCQRVVPAAGGLGAFGGGTEMKAALLAQDRSL